MTIIFHNANKHGRTQSVELYATSAAINPDLCVKTTYLNFSQRVSTLITVYCCKGMLLKVYFLRQETLIIFIEKGPKGAVFSVNGQKVEKGGFR